MPDFWLKNGNILDLTGFRTIIQFKSLIVDSGGAIILKRVFGGSNSQIYRFPRLR